jgi:hypothetical protein
VKHVMVTYANARVWPAEGSSLMSYQLAGSLFAGSGMDDVQHTQPRLHPSTQGACAYYPFLVVNCEGQSLHTATKLHLACETSARTGE